MLVSTLSYREFYEKQHNKEFNILLKSIAATKERFQKWTDDYEGIFNESIANNIDQFRQEILNDEYQIDIHPNYSLHIMYMLGLSSAYLLASMKWVIIEAPENLYFLTSDNPIIVTNPNCMGYYSPELLTENTRVFVPISKNIGLLMIRLDVEKLDGRYVKDNKEIVKEMNKTIVLMASRFIYAPERNDKIIRMIENVNSKLEAVQQKIRNENEGSKS